MRDNVPSFLLLFSHALHKVFTVTVAVCVPHGEARGAKANVEPTRYKSAHFRRNRSTSARRWTASDIGAAGASGRGKRFPEISRGPSIRIPLATGISFSANISSRLRRRRRRPSCFRTRVHRKRPDVLRQSAVAEKSRDYEAWINREETGCR